MTDRLLAQIAAIANASLSDLRAQWRGLFGSEAPGINRAYLERRIAYRLQELAYGGLSEGTKDSLATLAKTADKGSSARTRLRAQDRPIAGTRLLRVWNGVEHSVTVLQTGFDYNGRSFESLSAVARHITGSRWNGPAFFGLRERRL
jgi:hypothetical protein